MAKAVGVYLVGNYEVTALFIGSKYAERAARIARDAALNFYIVSVPTVDFSKVSPRNHR